MAPFATVFQPRADQLAWSFGGVAPILRVRPGEVLDVWTEDAFGGRIASADDIPSERAPGPRLNPQTGPFHVEDAAAGGTLAVHIADLVPARGWGVATVSPSFGAVAATEAIVAGAPVPSRERVWIYRVEAGDLVFSAADSDVCVRIPRRMHLGTIAVAPREPLVRSTLEPGDFGGNMDTPLVRPGTTVHLPIAVDGALLSVGDAHYAMADGEPCGTGVEGPAWARLVTAVLGGHAIAWPRLETDDEVMVAASARPLETAYRIAWAELVRWVRDETGLSGDDALQLVGQTGRATLGNVCNPSYTVVARVAKAHLPPAAWMDGAHAALRAAAGLVAAPLGPPAHAAEGGALIRMPSP